jgi:hypothetical protein
MPEKSHEQKVADGLRLDNFLKDELIAGIMTKLERKFYEEFKASDTSEKRVRAWAKAAVLDEWENEFRIVGGIADAAKVALAAESKKRTIR